MIWYRYVLLTALLSLSSFGFRSNVKESPNATREIFDIDYQPYSIADCADLGFSLEGGQLRLVSPQYLTTTDRANSVHLVINDRDLDYTVSWYDLPDAQGELLQSATNAFDFDYANSGTKSVNISYNYKGKEYNYTTNFDLDSQVARMPLSPFAVSITGSPFIGCYIPGDVLNWSATSTNPLVVDFLWNMSAQLSPTTANGTSIAVTVLTQITSFSAATVTVIGLDAGGNPVIGEVTAFQVYCNDNTNPTFTPPPSITISCTQDTTTSTTGYVGSLNDNCTPVGLLSVRYTTVQTSMTQCTTRYARTWRVSDQCGNTGSVPAQQITVIDNTAPTLTMPANQTVSCGASTSPGSTGSATATDDCHNPVIPSYIDNIVYDCPGPTQLASGYTINRTWTATDVCLNSTSQVQSIRVNPAPAPTFTAPSLPAITCSAAASYTPPTLTYTNGQSGNCLISGSANGTITSSSFNACSGGTISISWTASGCGWGPITQTGTVTVNPAPAATWSVPSLPGSLTCANAATFSAPTLSYSNGGSAPCANSETVTPSVTNNFDECGGTIDIVWTGTGPCPPAPYTASIPVTQAANPTWGPDPVIGPITCAQASSGSFSIPAITYDNGGSGTCSVAGTVNGTVTSSSYDECGGTVTVTYPTPPGLPVCFSLAPHTVVVTVSPAPNPTWAPTPSIGPITCAQADAGSFVIPPLTYSNGGSAPCLVSGSVNGSVTSSSWDECGGTLVVTYLAPSLPACFSLSNVTVSVTVDPAPNPTWSPTPSIGPITCAQADAGSFVIPPLNYSNGGSASCLVSGTVNGSVTSETWDECGGTLVVTYPAPSLPACFSLSDVTVSVSVNPAPAPTWSPTPVIGPVTCAQADAGTFVIPPLNYSNGLSAPCGVSGSVNGVVSSSSYDACGGTVIVTYPAPSLPACFTLPDVTVSVTVNQAPAPVWNPTPSIGPVTCAEANAGSFTIPALGYTNGASGGCDVSGTVNGAVTSSSWTECGGTLTVTYPAPSLPGCFSLPNITVSVTVSPAPAPVWDPTPSIGPVTCAEANSGSFTIPDLAYTNGESGSCDVSGTVSGTVTGSTWDECGGTLTITYPAPSLPPCFTLADVTVLVTVDPAPAPVWDPAPSIGPVTCAEADAGTFVIPPLAYDNGESGSCDVSGTVNGSVTNATWDECGGTLEITYPAPSLPACFTLPDVTVTVTVNPAPAPTWSPAPSLGPITCAEADAGTLTIPPLNYSNGATGPCTVSGSVNGSITSSTYDQCGGTVIVTYPAPGLPSCFTLPDVTVSVTVNPAPAPVWDPTPSIGPVTCAEADGGSFTIPDLAYSNGESGSCDVSGTVSGTVTSSTWDECGGTLTVTYPAPTLPACFTLPDVTVSVTVNPAPAPVWDPAPALGPITCAEANSGTFTIPPLAYSNGESGSCDVTGTVNGTITSSTFDECGGSVVVTYAAPSLPACFTLPDITVSVVVDPAPAPVWDPAPSIGPVTCAEANSGSFTIPDLAYTNGESGSCDVSGTVSGSITSSTWDECGGTLTITYPAPVLPSCFTLADVTVSVTVDPAPAPVWDPAPALGPITCAAADAGTLIIPPINYGNGESGSCDVSGTVNGSITSSTYDECGGTVIVTYPAPSLPACFTLSDLTVSVTVDPAPAPAWNPTPVIGPITCAEADASSFTIPSLDYTNSETGSCLVSGTVNGTISSTSYDQCGGTVVVTYPAPTLPACFSLPDVTVSVTVNPAPAPAWDPTPSIGPVTCAEADAGTFTIPDLLYSNGESGSCDVSGTVTGTITSSTYDACGGTVIVTYPAPTLPACFTLPDVTVSVAVDPAPAPVWDPAPAIGPITCSEANTGTFTIPSLNYGNGESGACDVSGSVTGTVTNSAWDECGGVLTVTYPAPVLAPCFSLPDVTVSVTVDPAAAPVWDPTPSIGPISCAEADASSFIIPPLNYGNGESGTCDVSGSVTGTVTNSAWDECGGTITITYTAPSLPACFSLTDVVVTVTVDPAPNPVWDPSPAIGPITCAEADAGTFSIPALNYGNGAIGGCLVSGTVNGIISNSTYDACGGTVEVIYPAPSLAACFSLADVTVSVNVLPAPAPIWDPTPAIPAVTCADADASSFVIPPLDYSNGESGACSITGTVNGTITSTSYTPCGGTLVITYPAPSLACGGLTDVTVSVNVLPAPAPVWDPAPVLSNVTCADADAGTLSLPQLAYSNAESGSCLVEGLVDGIISSTAYDECGGTLTVTYPAPALACGSLADVTVSVTVDPAPAANWINPPADQTFTCDQAATFIPPSLDYSNAESGGCLITGSAVPTVSNNFDGCGGTIELDWTFTDACSRTINHHQTIFVDPAAAPVFTSTPADATIACDAVASFSPSDLTYTNGATGGCLINGTVSPTVVLNTLSCNDFIYVTWSYTDACGRLLEYTQSIEVIDDQPPTFTVPGAITLSCDQDPSDLGLTGDVNDEADNCSTGLNATYTDNATLGCNGSGSITRTWSLTDDCGNVTTKNQTITIVDDQDPVINCPGDVTLSCDISELPPYADFNEFQLAFGSASDNCGLNQASFALVSETSNGATCPEIVTRVYQIEDNCGNVATCSQQITIHDTEAPTINGISADITVDCGSIPPTPVLNVDVTANDNCIISSFTVNETTLPGSCESNYQIQRVYTAIDACGNSSTGQQTVTVENCFPTVNVSIAPDEICEGGSSTISATVSGVFTSPAYQWEYSQNGSGWAPVGSGPSLVINNATSGDAGYYRVIVADIPGNIGDPNCSIVSSQVYLSVIPHVEVNLNEIVCPGEVVTVGSSNFSIPGTYDVTLVSSAGCDSIVHLNLSNYTLQTTNLDQIICDGESVNVGGSLFNTTGDYTVVVPDVHGCDSTILLHLTVMPNLILNQNARLCFGEDITIGGQTFNTTGNYTVNLQTIFGCDSIINLNLVVEPELTRYLDIQICQGQSYNFYGTPYNISGNYSTVVTGAGGCDTTVYLNLDVVSTITRTITRTICNGDSVLLGSTYYKTDGTYMETFTSSAGCDSIVTLNLTVVDNISTILTETICEGDTYRVGSNDYSTSGTYVNTFTSGGGCDSTVTLNLTVVPHRDSSIVADICQGSVYRVGGNSYNTTGVHTVTVQNAYGCDSTITLDLTVHPEYTQTNQIEICQGESVITAQGTYTTSGTYQEDYVSSFGCDSTVVIRLTVRPDYDQIITRQVCEGSSVTIGSHTYNTTGTYVDSLQTRFGCDSVIHLNLTVLQELTSTVDRQICNGQTFTFGTQTLSASGTYTETFTSQAGCDSVVTLNLSVVPQITTTLDEVICEGETYFLGATPYTASGTYTGNFTSSSGCDSIVTLNLTVSPTIRYSFDQPLCDGESIVFNGQSITRAGTYRDTVPSVSGCDSIVTMRVQILNTFNREINQQICNGATVTFGGQQIGTSGTYMDTLTSINGCDSIITLNLQVLPQITRTIDRQICTGQTFNFNGDILVSSGTYVDTLQTSGGCDSIVTLNLAVLPALLTDLDVQICTGQTYDFNGTTLNSAGTYKDTLSTSGGCDSIITLNLVINDNFQTEVNRQICDGETYDFFGQILDMTGTYTHTLASTAGCDSIITLNLEVAPSFTESISAAICQGESYTFNGQTLNTSGTYVDTLQSAGGCDSIVTLELTVNDLYAVNLTQQICEGESYQFDGQPLTTSGTYTANLISVTGCDSIITLDLLVLPQLTTTLNVDICAGQSYAFDGQNLNSTGTYTEQLVSASGCDSVVTLNLNVLDKILRNVDRQICSGQTFTFGGQTLTAAGTYVDTLASAFGCDSIVTLNLEVLDQLTTTLNESICQGESYVFDGQNETTSGTYTANLTAASGCDSIVTLNLTVIDPVQEAISATICDGETYDFDGQVLTRTGTYTATLSAASGCDSIVTLDLTVLPAPSTSISEEICEGQTFMFFGNALSTSGTYQEIAQTKDGCDSTVTLVLTVVSQKTKTINRTICSSQVYPFDGQNLNASGTYTATFKSAAGCDSIVTLNLVVADQIQETISQQICEGQSVTFGGNTLTTAGTYVDTFVTDAGCDSIVTLELTVNNQIMQSIDQQICEGESYVFDGKSLKASGTYTATYQTAFGCDSIVILNLAVLESLRSEDNVTLCEGESMDYLGLLIDASGDYEVTLTSANGCDSIITIHADVLPALHENVLVSLCQGDSVEIDGDVYGAEGSFTKSYQSSNGCDSIVSYTIEVIPEKTLIGIDQDICLGDDALLKVTAGANLDLYWEGPGLSCTSCRQPKVSPTETTTYTVKTIGCSGDTISAQVTVNVYETPDMIMPENVEIKKGESSTITVQTSSPDVILDWYANGELICSDCKSVTVNPDKTTTYIVQASNPAGCLAEADFIVFVADDCEFDKIEIANAMTPNNDGRNDDFIIRNSGSSTLESLKIFNRWGELIFATKDVENDRWDGTYKNQALTSGVYVYLLEGYCAAGDKFVKSGNISIIR
ncbi:MAG: gliding motility-associated C-terminal domain-containing protein [Saprospiraceae bacterium]|nr:gliding motility-associated C-terminal domain-containing protein [Saprospiraceae bacterium]